MENNIENNLSEVQKINSIQDFINKIKNKLKQENIWVIDRFEGELVICENRNTKQLISIKSNQIPSEAKEGDVLKLVNGKYELDYIKKSEIQNTIDNKMKNLFEEE